MHNYAIMHIGAAYLSIHNSARVPSRQEKARDAPYAPFSDTCGKSLSASALRASAVQNVFFRIAEKALPTCRRAFPAARERLFRCKEKALHEPERAFPHHEDTGKACPDSLYSRPDMPPPWRKSLFRAPPFSLSRKTSVNIFYFHECIIMHSRSLRPCPVSARRRLSRQSLRSPAAHSGHSPLST